MTTYPRITLACDEPMCFERFEGSPNADERAVRNLAFDGSGWSVIDGKDYCPQHGRQREYNPDSLEQQPADDHEAVPCDHAAPCNCCKICGREVSWMGGRPEWEHNE